MNELYEVEEGIAKVRQALPEVVRCPFKELECLGSNGNNLELGIRGGSYRLAWSEGQTFKSRCGIDPTMLSALNANLQEEVWRELVSDREGELIFKLASGSVVGVSQDEAAIPDYRKWLDRVIEEVPDLHGISNLHQHKSMLSFGAVTNRVMTPPKRVNDAVHQGIAFAFNGKVSARAYNLRLVCTNGMTGMDFGSEYVLQENDYKSQIARAMDAAESLTRRYVSLAEKPIENVAGIVGSLSQRGILQASQTARIVEQVSRLDEGDSLYDFVNLVTQQQHERNDQSWLGIGARIVEYLQHSCCGHCGHPV